MQNEFPMFRKIEVELTQEKEIEKIPDRPSKWQILKSRVYSPIKWALGMFSTTLIEMAFNAVETNTNVSKINIWRWICTFPLTV